MSAFASSSLQNLLKDFYNLTNIKTCVYDLEGNELCYYPSKLCSFCELLRTDARMDERCRECDRMGFLNCRRTHAQYVYTCHAGLRECISPILYDNRIVGFIMIGQIKPSAHQNFSDIEANVPPSLRPELGKIYDALPSIPEQKLLSAFRILDACAGYELLRTLVGEDATPIDAKLEKYISEHLGMPLSVSELCSRFHLSRSELYHIMHEYFSATPAEYIKQRRLEHAARLLRTTSLSVREIASSSGIPDYNYFSKVFKAAFDKSPLQYRKG